MEIQPGANQNLTDSSDSRPTASEQPWISDRPEIAHVLFMDVVGFTTLAMEEQREILKLLQQVVRGTAKFREAEMEKRLISLPTGDGMALAFFTDPVWSVECALEMSSQLRNHRHLKLRMGLNTGLVYRHLDINANLNVQGGGINEAQRIMDAGDAGHILMSKETAGLLLNLRRWAPDLHDLGEHAVKHGKKLHFYSFYTSELGNPALPAKFRAERAHSNRVRAARVSVAVLALAAAAVAGIAIYREYTAIKRRQHVAVMGFRNSRGDASVDWVAGDLADNMRAQLGESEKVRTMSAQQCAEMWKNLGLRRVESLSKEVLNRLNGFGADWVVVGSFTDLGQTAGGKVRINVELQDAREGETIFSVSDQGTEADLDKLVGRIAARLRVKLGEGELSQEKVRQLELAQAPAGAREFYYPGITKLRDYEPVQARSYLERAVTLEPAYPFGHAALAMALSELGYDSKATDEAKQAVDLSKGLSFEDQQSLEARYYTMAMKWDEAIRAYEKLYRYKKDSLEYGLDLANTQRSAGQGRAALKTLAELRRLPKPEGDDARIDLAEAETSKSLGDLRNALSAAEAAAQKANSSGARLLRARALHWACATFQTMGDPDKAKAACEESKNISSELGDKLGIARAITILGHIQLSNSDLEGAARLYEQAMENAKQVGSQKDVSGALNNIGMILDEEGKLEPAKESYQKALAIEREIDFKTEIPGTLNNLAIVMHKQGNLEGARKTLKEAIDVAQQSGAKESQADALENLGDVLVDLGNLTQAERAYAESITIQPDKSNKAATVVALGDLLVLQARLPEAKQRYGEALAMQDDASAAAGKIGLANILLAAGSTAEAEAAIRSELGSLSKSDAGTKIQAGLVLINALLAERKVADAQKEVASLNSLMGAGTPRNLRYGAMIAAARIQAAAKDQSAVTTSIASLNKIAQEAKKAGTPGLELEARLAIGEIELEDGRVSLARKDLAEVQRDASAKGFKLIEQRAATAARG